MHHMNAAHNVSFAPVWLVALGFREKQSKHLVCLAAYSSFGAQRGTLGIECPFFLWALSTIFSHTFVFAMLCVALN